MKTRAMTAAALALGLIAGTTTAFAANKKAGTSAAPFLKMNAGARPAAMAGAFTGLADDVNAVAYNPAGIARLERSGFTAMHSPWIQQSSLDFIAGAFPFAWGALSVSVRSFRVDDIDRRLTDTLTPDGTFDASDAAYTVGYARKLGGGLAAGANLSMVRSAIAGESASAVAVDAGLLWKKSSPLSLGLAIRNAGTELKFVDEGDPLPMTMALGGAYKFFGEKLTTSVELKKPNDDDWLYAGGLEAKRMFARELEGSIRGGYGTDGDDVTGGLSGVSFGLGLKWRSFGFDMAWVPYGDLGQTFRYALRVDF